MHKEEKELFQEKLNVKALSVSNNEIKMGFELFKTIAKKGYVWAFCIFGFLDLFQLFSIVTNTPFYLNEVLTASTNSISYVQLCGGLGSSVICIICVMLLSTLDKNVQWIKSRLTFLFVPQVVRLISFFIFPQMTSMSGAAVILIILWCSYGTAFSGSIVTINYEIDPERASIILGIFNGLGILGGFLSPLVRVWITNVEKSTTESYESLYRKSWSYFYYLNGGASAVIILVVLVAVIFRSHEWQLHPSIANETELKTKSYELEVDINEYAINMADISRSGSK